MSRQDHRRHDTALQKLRNEISAKPKERHVTECLIASVSGLGEYLAVRYGIHWLAYLAALFLWLAVMSYTKDWYQGKKWLQTGIRGVAAAFVFLGTYSLIGWKVATENSQEPLVYLQPDFALSDPSGLFHLEMANKGVEIDYINVRLHYFIALKRNEAVTVCGVFEWEDGPNPMQPPLRTNQSMPVPISFKGTNFLEPAFEDAASRYPAMLGVRVGTIFRRYRDGKEFSKWWVYRKAAAIGPEAIYSSLSSLNSSLLPEMKDNIVTLNEVMPYMDSDEHWAHGTIKLTGHPNGKPSVVLECQ